MNYYFLATVLPELRIGSPIDISFNELVTLLEDNLSAADLEKTKALRRSYDLENIRSFWKGEELDPHGNFDENDLEEALLTEQGFPRYVYDFLEKYESKEERLQHFSELIMRYMEEEIDVAQAFLKKYFKFEKEMRLILAAFRSKKLGRGDLLRELQYEDPEDQVVAQIIAQKDSKTFEPPSPYEDLKPLFETNQDNPLALYKAINEYRFAWMEELLDFDTFSINRILGYLVEFITLENWLKLDQKQGVIIMDQILRETS